MMDYEIRRAKRDDISQINRLMIDGINETSKNSSGDIHQIDSWDSNIESLIGALEQNSNFIFVAITSNKVIGVIFAYAIQKPEVPFFTKRKRLYIESLDVDSRYRSMGIGTSLIRKIEVVAKEHSVEAIELEVYSNNTTAEGLYETLGFEEIKKRMRKELSHQQ